MALEAEKTMTRPMETSSMTSTKKGRSISAVFVFKGRMRPAARD